jgi:BirA family transcriptional regulator, biotin operon repressor / biotin---[acetyl-CoA-carboxylase] ligase
MVTAMPGGDARTGLDAALRGTRFGVRWVEETGSTNGDLLVAAAHGAGDGAVLVADHQRSGHGRQGRRWEAPPESSLLVSILLRPELGPDRLHLLTTAVAVAAAVAVEEVAGVRAGLKWPNDLVVGDRKLGGILAEAAWAGERLDAVVVGLGLNVAFGDELSGELADTAVSLDHLTDRPVDRAELLVALLLCLEELLGELDRDELLERWRERATTLGRSVRVELVSGAVLEGTAVDLTAAGHLLVATPTGDVEIAAGDVHHLRPT